LAKALQIPATRRTFIKVLGLGAPAMMVNPWINQPDVVALQPMVGIFGDYDRSMRLDPAWEQAQRNAHVSPDYERDQQILNTALESIRPYFTYLEFESDPAYRAYRIVAAREYRNEKGEFNELGWGVLIKRKDLYLAGDKVAAIPWIVLDAFARAERQRGWTWNQATLIGYC
jgi:hypothetical protein